YTTLLMATGLTFGTISALFGLQNHIIDQRQYTILVSVVILSAFVPTLIAQKFFQPTVEAMHAWGQLYRRRLGILSVEDCAFHRHQRRDYLNKDSDIARSRFLELQPVKAGEPRFL